MIYRYVVIQLTNTYGNLRARPVGPAAAAFAKIAGTTTLTPAVLRSVLDLGLHVMADGSSRDIVALERAIGTVTSERMLFRPDLIEYHEGAEDELGPIPPHVEHIAERT